MQTPQERDRQYFFFSAGPNIKSDIKQLCAILRSYPCFELMPGMLTLTSSIRYTRDLNEAVVAVSLTLGWIFFKFKFRVKGLL